MRPPDTTGNSLPVKVYERAPAPGTGADQATPQVLAKFRVFLEDRPGSLAAFAALLQEHRGNEIYMLYDEDIDSAARCGRG